MSDELKSEVLILIYDSPTALKIQFDSHFTDFKQASSSDWDAVLQLSNILCRQITAMRMKTSGNKSSISTLVKTIQ